MKLQINTESQSISLPETVVNLDTVQFKTTQHTTVFDFLEVLGAILGFDVEVFNDTILCSEHYLEYEAPLCPECAQGLPPRVPFTD